MLIPRCSLAVFLISGLGAQDATAPRIELPRLLKLGPRPAADASARILRIDRRTEVAAAVKQIEAAHAEGAGRVHLAAVLPDGTPGFFTLALPEKLESTTTLDLRLHHERPGVPPGSVVPLLERIQRTESENFVLGVEAPGDAPFEQLLRALAAVADANIARVVLRANPPDHAESKALAMDLGPTPQLRVRPLSLPPEPPGIHTSPVGCLERAAVPWAPFLGGGAGGRYGGRGGGGRLKAFEQAIGTGRSWFPGQQHADGSFANATGTPDLEATALVMLVLLGGGTTLDSGANRDTLNRATGWLLSRQDERGSFVGTGPRSVRQHALATYALTEAFGLSSSGTLVRGAVQDAVARFQELEQSGGGFADDAAQGEADCVTTALCMSALATAKFFGLPVTPTVTEVADWFDTVATDNGLHRLQENTAEDSPINTTATAAALFARFFAGQDPAEIPLIRSAADQLVERADPGDPWCAYWTTYALYQTGGLHWKAWNQQLGALVDSQILEGEFEGTWEPTNGCSRITMTALRVLTLQAYYRYTRLVR